MSGRIGDWIEDRLDEAVGDQKRDALEVNRAARAEGGETECGAERPVGVAQNREWQSKTRDQLAVIFRGLTA